MRAAKRLQTIHLKDKQGRVVSSWQRARVPVPDGISVSLPSPYRGLKPPHEEGRAQPVAGISGFSMTASVDTVLEADQRGLQLDRKMDNLIRAARFEIDAVETGVKSNHCGHITVSNTARPGLQQSVRFAHGQLEAGQPQVPVLWLPPRKRMRDHNGRDRPQPRNCLSCVVEPPHMGVAGGEKAIRRREARIFLDRGE